MKLVIIDTSVILHQIADIIDRRWWMQPINAIADILTPLVIADRCLLTELKISRKKYTFKTPPTWLFFQSINTAAAIAEMYKQEAANWDYTTWAAESQVYAQSAITYTNALTWAPSLQSPDTRVVWAMDSKPYWRSRFQSDYKAGRSAKPSCYGDLLKLVAQADISTIAFPGYEADDVAAAIVRMWDVSKKENIKSIYLATVDSDWLALIRHGVTWVNTAQHTPRVRGKLETFTWLRSKWNAQPKKWQAVWPLPSQLQFRPTDVWEWKLMVGDKADNIPPGAPRYMVDLMNPPSEYDLTAPAHQMDILKAIGGAKVIDVDAGDAARGVMFYFGANLPIDPLVVDGVGAIAAA
jgi:hypothetical protein